MAAVEMLVRRPFRSIELAFIFGANATEESAGVKEFLSYGHDRCAANTFVGPYSI